MELADDLLCLFSGTVSRSGESYVIEIPKYELDSGQLQNGDVYRVALLGQKQTPTESRSSTGSRAETGPPVDPGEKRTVDIEAIGEQGDGIARVERGFVVIVPDTKKGERVAIEITDVTDSVAFAEVHERKPS